MILRRATFRQLCRARDRLAAIDDCALTVRELAREIDASPFHLIRQFEAVFGLTPHQFRIERRLERARHLLALGDLSITEVCLEVGFQSLGSFSDRFSRRVGVPPSAYRRHIRSLVQVPASIPKVLMPGCFNLMAQLPAHAFRNFEEA